jgi:iron complex outermembrane receptor protein
MKFLAALLVLLPGMAAAQSGSSGLAGSVMDAVGAPIAGATVSLTGGARARTATTDADGRFRIEGIPPGSYDLRVTGDRVRESKRTVTLTPDDVVEVNVELQPAFADRVVVTASRGPQTLLSSPSSVSVISGQDIETSAADSFADVLRGVPGLNIVQFGSRDVEVNSRSSTGILSNSTLVMVDGRSFFQPLYGAVYWDLMSVGKDEISQIEVLRTPASALWGANALNGVINVLTKSPRQMKGLRGSVGFGERGTKTFGAVWADATDRVSYKISSSYFEQDAWERDNLLPDGSPMPVLAQFVNRGTRQPKVDVRVDWDADRNRVWSVRGGMAGANGLIHSALGPVEFESGSYYSYLELDYRSEDVGFKAYWNRLDSPFRLVLFGLDESSTNDTYVSELTRRLRLGRHTLTFGGSLRADRFDITVAPADTGRVDAAAFVENRMTVNSTLSVIAGGRLDKFDTTGAVFSPRVGAVVTPLPAHSFRATYNRAYRAPSLLENFVDVSLPSVVPTDPPFVYFQRSLGSTELEMEKQDAFEIGYTGALTPRTVVFATAYHQSIKNNVWFLPVSFYGPGAPPPGWPGDPNAVPPFLPNVFSFVNLGRVRDRGIELGVRNEWPTVSVQGAYTFRGTPLLESGTNLPLQINRPARHQANGSLSYISDRWTVGTDIHYTGRTFWADVLTEPFWGWADSYVGVNARVGYRVPARPWELWVAATDLFDEKIKSHVYGDIVRRKVSGGIRWHSN